MRGDYGKANMAIKSKAKEKLNSARTHWYLWLFPVIALMFTAFLMRGYIGQQGPMIEISFDSAASIQPEKTRVRYRGVTIGVLKDLKLAKDKKSVIAKIRLYRENKSFAVEGSRYWVVTPKVGMAGITGIEAIFDGTYIGVQPGPEGGKLQTRFNGKLVDDSDEDLEDTSTYYLETSNVESLNSGDAVTFRGLNVGSVTKVTLSRSAQTAVIQINIQNRYSRLIRTNTVFWKKIGVQAKLGLFGSEIKVNSMDSILRGGVEFFTPTKAGEMAKNKARFGLLPTPPKDYEKWNPNLE